MDRELADFIIDNYGHRRPRYISNEEIFKTYTGRKRFNKKAWNNFKPRLTSLVGKHYRGIWFITYQPMLKSPYNLPRPDLNEFFAGFHLVKEEMSL